MLLVSSITVEGEKTGYLSKESFFFAKDRSSYTKSQRATVYCDTQDSFLSFFFSFLGWRPQNVKHPQLSTEHLI